MELEYGCPMRWIIETLPNGNHQMLPHEPMFEEFVGSIHLDHKTGLVKGGWMNLDANICKHCGAFYPIRLDTKTTYLPEKESKDEARQG